MRVDIRSSWLAAALFIPRATAILALTLLVAACDISSLIPIPQPPGQISGLVQIPQAPPEGLAVTVLAGVQSDGMIRVKSDFVDVLVEPGATSASFRLPGVAPGTYSVFAWRNVNANDAVDRGDWFGKEDNVVVRGGQTTTGVIVTVSQYTGSPIRIGR